MTKRFSLRKVAITLLSALFVLCASFGIVSAKNANSVKADEVVAFQMLDGADLRLDAENNGLRFAATVPSDYVEGDVYQMLIVPASWIKDVEIPNGDYIAYLEATYPQQELAIAPLHPITWAEESVAGFEEGKRYFLGAITDIRYENLNREFFAVAYRTNGEVREYATFNEGQNVRSVFYIASAYAGVYEAGTDSAKIVDNFIVSAINQKAGVAEADKFNAISYDLSIAGSDTVKIGETASYAVAGTVGGVNISSLNAIVSYSVEGNGASISADGVLSVSEEGTVTVKAFVLGQELTKTVVVEKAIKDVTIDMGNYVLNTKDVEGIDFVIEGIEGAPISVSYKLSSERELDVATLTYDAVAQTLTIPYATVKGLYGPYTTTFTITTDSAIYTVNVVFVTLAISDASQINAGSTSTVNQMQRLGGAETGASGSYYGYYILTNDIDFGGKEVLHTEYSLWDSKGGAHIKLDGNGYALKNFLVKSVLLFDTLGQDVNGAKSSFENLGFIGTVEGDYGLFGYYHNVHLNNCYFDIKVPERKAAFGSYYGPWMGDVKNTTFVISGLNGGDVNFTAGDVNTSGYNWSGSVMLIDAENAVVDGKLQGAKIYDYSDNFVSVAVTAGEDAVVEMAGVTKVLRAGKDITAKVIINENNVVIPSAETSETEAYVVISDTSAKIISLEVQRTEHNAVLGYSKRNVDATAAADFSYEVNGTVVYATIDGSEVEYAEDNGVVTIESVKAISSGSKARNLVIATETDIYHIALTVADYVITSAEDYSSMNWQKAFGRAEGVKWGAGLKAVVLADLDFGGANVSFGPILNEWASNGAGFVGSLDFNGYAIHNLTFSNNLLGDNILGDATISNLRLYDYTCTDVLTSWYHNSVKYGWYIEGARTKFSMGPSDGGSGLRNWFRNGIIINTNESEGVEETLMTSGGGDFSCGNLNVQEGFDAYTIQGYPSSYMIGNGKFLPADAWGQDETRCGTYNYSANVVTPAIEDGSVTVDLGFTATAVYKDGAKLDIDLGSTIVIENAEVSATYLAVGSGAVKIIRPTIVAEEVVVNNYVAYASKTNDNGEIVSNDMVFEVESAVANVTIGAASVPFTTDGSNVVVASDVLKSNTGAKVITIETLTKKYVINATIGTFGITKLSDVCAPTHVLAPWRVAGGATSNNFKEAGSASSGYIVLTTNLVGTGAEMFHDGTIGTSQIGGAGNNAAYGFTGTFDGCGYSITNVVMGTTGAWVSGFGLTRSSAVIKNLTMQFTTQGAHFQGLFNEYATGTIENCTFDITANSSGRIFGGYLAGLTVKDSTIIVRTGTGTLSDALAPEGVHADGMQGSSVSKGASFVNTTLYTDYPVNEAYAGYGLVTKSIAEIPA